MTEHHEPGRTDLFRECLRYGCEDLDQVIEFARSIAPPPMDDMAIVRAASAAWAHPGASMA
jgi:hypothetical protein